MGYNTDFSGSIDIDPPLDLFLTTKINDLANDYDAIVDPPVEHGWLQWVIDEDGDSISWDGGEKFYDAATWMKWLIDTYIAPAGSICNGEIEAQGDESDDRWLLIVENNRVYTQNCQFAPVGTREEVT